MGSLKGKAGAASADAKTKIDADITALQSDVKAAEIKLSETRRAMAVRWREFEADVSAATARLRKSTEKALGCGRRAPDDPAAQCLGTDRRRRVDGGG